MSGMYKVLVLPLVLIALAVCGCQTMHTSNHASYSHFTGLTDLSDFTRTQNPDGGVVLLSPEIQSPNEWNQLVLSWNATAAPGTFITIEACAIQSSHITKFYTWGLWSPDDKAYPRASIVNQKDADGDVRADTLALNAPAKAVQIRLTLGGTNGTLPSLKFFGISFCDTQIKPPVLAPNRAAWGKIIPTPERSQQSYPGGGGWCSPTSLSMALARWGTVSNRVDWNLDAPEVAAGVADHGFKFLTGNWS